MMNETEQDSFLENSSITDEITSLGQTEVDPAHVDQAGEAFPALFDSTSQSSAGLEPLELNDVLLVQTLLNKSANEPNLKTTLIETNSKLNKITGIAEDHLAKNLAKLLIQAVDRNSSEIEEGNEIQKKILKKFDDSLKDEGGILKWKIKSNYFSKEIPISPKNSRSDKASRESFCDNLSSYFKDMSKSEFENDAIRQQADNLRSSLVYMFKAILPKSPTVPGQSPRQGSSNPPTLVSTPGHSRSLSARQPSISVPERRVEASVEWSNDKRSLADSLKLSDSHSPEKLAKMIPVEEKLDSKHVPPFSMTDPFLARVLELKRFVLAEFLRIATLPIENRIQSYKDNCHAIDTLLVFSECGNSTSKLKTVFEQLLKDSTLVRLPDFFGQTHTFNVLLQLRDVLSRKDFLELLTAVEYEFKQNKTPYNNKLIMSLKLLHEQAKDSEIDHVFVTIVRDIIGNSITLSRSAVDHSIAVVLYKRANASRTALDAMTRKDLLIQNADLCYHSLQMMQLSLHHDGFVAIVARYHTRQAEHILQSYIYATYFLCEFEIKNWTSSYGIPDDISMLVFDLLFHIRRVMYLIEVSAKLPRKNNTRLSAYTSNFVSDYDTRMILLMKQKNTLDDWVRVLKSPKDYEKYRRYIDHEMYQLDKLLNNLDKDPNPLVTRFKISYSQYINQGNIFVEFIFILNTHKDLLGDFQPSDFPLLTSARKSELLDAFDKLADKYQLNILSNPKKN